MAYARSRTTARLVFCLIVVAGLMIAALALTPFSEASRDKTPATRHDRLERGYRLRERAPGAPTNRMNAAPLAPMFATIDVDRTDDAAAASACTAAANDCSLRGAVSFANLNPGTTINVPAGTYSLNIPGGVPEGFSGNNLIGDLDIAGNNTIITGAGAATTIIQQTQPNDRVIEVNPNLDASFTTSISDVTITGGKETTGVGGGGIISGSINNSLTVTNCVFSGNSATGAGSIGGGGLAHTGGNLTITGTTFSNNSASASGGGVGYSSGDPLGRTPSSGALSVSGSTFNSNTSNSVAGGGGALDLYDFNLSSSTYTVTTSTFSSNTAPTGSGGAIIVESGGPLTVTTSALTGNSAGNAGGAVFSVGSASVTYSRLFGNTAVSGLTLFKAGAVFTADDNWWGINTGPSAGDIGGGISVASYLKLRLSATATELCSGQTSALSADIKERSSGGALTTELNGLPTFTATWNATLGTISAATNFVDGAATATYTAGGTTGMGSASVMADNQTVSVNINVDTNDTTNPGNQVVCEGQTATFSTTASGPGPITFVWKKGATVLNNGDLGGRVTITNGSNTSTLSISNAQLSDADTYTVEATGQCNTTTESATLTVNATTMTTDPVDQTVCQGTDAHFSTVASGTGPFSYAWTLDGNPVGGNSPNVTIPTGALSLGDHTVTVTTTGACNSATQTATLTVSSGTPVINLHTTSVTMWPPNHQYQTFDVDDFVSSATAGCGGGDITNSVVIQKVSSDEPEENPAGADGNTLNDIVIAGDCKSVQLRRERDGNLNGRVYTITFKVTDSFGNSATATVKVSVPKNNGGTAVDNGAAAGYTVNSSCP
jgi:Immunoglobulin I-set domain